MTEAPAPTVLLSAAEVARRVEALAEALAAELSPDTVAVALLTGGLWFAADLTRALAGRGLPLDFDAVWLSAYGDARTPGRRCRVLAGLQRPVRGRPVLLLDDVLDSGLSLAEADRIVREAGASQVRAAVFARKPWPSPRPVEARAAWDAPARFLVGYGMDRGGGLRGLPHIAALD